jgi:multiple sugar transport system substrate-binding protein
MADDDSHNANRTSVRSISRRRVLQTSGAAGIASIAGCTGFMGGTGDDGVEYWTLFDGGDGDVMSDMVEEINESDDHDVQINGQQVPFDEYYDRLYTSLTGDEKPDVAVLHADTIEEYGDLVVPLTDEIGTDPYVDDVAEAGVRDGEQLAVPLDTHPIAIYYNRDLFEEAGLDPDEPPNTPERFQEAANTIADETDYLPFQYHDGPFSVDIMRMFITGQGGEFLTEDLEPAFDSDEGLTAVEEIHDWVHEHEWAPDDSDTGWDAWNRGEAGMIFEGTWHVGIAQDADFDFSVAEPFVLEEADEPVTHANSHLLVIPDDENRDEERQEEAVETIRLLTQEYNAMWGAEAGHLPASEEALESDELRESELWDRSLETFYEMAEAEQLDTPPATPNNEEYTTQIYQPLDDMRTGNLTPEEALEEAVEGVDQTFD